MNIADTSFLFSLYGNDAHTASASAWLRRQKSPISISALSRYELGNALRFAAFRKVVLSADTAASLAAFESDIKTGLVQLTRCDLAAVINEASRLSSLHTIVGGHRSFDILHVATACVSNAKTFLTFDANQRKLAASVGLPVAP